MNENLNLTQVLKGCPKGTKLYSTIYGEVEFIRIDNKSIDYPIDFNTFDGYTISLTSDGRCNKSYDGECTLFPSKDQRDWNKWQRLFVDGDIVFYNDTISIFKEWGDSTLFRAHVCTYLHCEGFIDKNIPLFGKSIRKEIRLATQKEKQKLFQSIKDNDYKWNAETKTLEKLIKPKFNIEKGKWYVCTKDLLDNYANKAFCKGDTYLSTQDGSLIPSNSNVPFEVVCDSEYFRDWTIQDAKDGDVLFHSDSASNGIFIFKKISQRGTMQKVICYCDYDSEDGFCLGENHTCCWTDSKILHPATKEKRDLLFSKMKEMGYKWDAKTKILEKLSDNRFNPNTLKPFDKVLVKQYDRMPWCADLYSYYDEDDGFVACTGEVHYDYCIPYNEETKHLTGTVDDAPEFYRYWED